MDIKISKFCKKHFNTLSLMTSEESLRRYQIELEIGMILCECFHYSGFRIPLDIECCNCCQECTKWKKNLKRRKRNKKEPK